MPAVLRIEIRPTDEVGPVRYPSGSSGLWRSLVARFVWDEDVAGSNPVSPTTVSSTIVSSTDEQEPGLRSAEPVQF